jgi:hypothetical protein
MFLRASELVNSYELPDTPRAEEANHEPHNV